jgi:hypothetical protein
MLGMVEIPTKAGASAPYSCLPAGREGRVKPALSNVVYCQTLGFDHLFFWALI